LGLVHESTLSFFASIFLVKKQTSSTFSDQITARHENNRFSTDSNSSLQRNFRLGKGDVHDFLSGTDVQNIDDILVRYNIGKVDGREQQEN
jgi:hypothetical protein